MSPRISSDRYVRTGLALSYSGLGRAHVALAKAHDTSGATKQREWGEAHDWYQKSSSVWTDKNKRGEVENTERKDEEATGQGMKRCNRALADRLGLRWDFLTPISRPGNSE